MDVKDFKRICLCIAASLAETGAEVPEGHLYAATMGLGLDLEGWRLVRRALVETGLAEARPGPCLRATAKARQAILGMAAIR